MVELIDNEQTDYDIEVDTVVVGAGACGMVASLLLAEAGIDTLLLERDDTPRGSTSMSSGFIPAAGTLLQESAGVSDSAELFAADIQRKANAEADPQIVSAVTQSCGKVLDWLQQQHGLEWVLLEDFLYPGHSTHRMHAVPEKTGAALHARLSNAVERAGVSIATSARVVALIVEPAAATKPVQICGVRVRRPDNSSETIKASAVILACNGYGANSALMKRFIPEMAEAYYHGHPGNTGDAVIWGELLDAALVHTSAYQGHGSLAYGHNILITWALLMEGGVQINQRGQRFSNEHKGYSEQAVEVIRQPGDFVWNVYDHRLHAMGQNFPDYLEAVAAGALVCADSVSELSDLTAMPLTDLQKTLQEIEQLASVNGTDQFGRQFNSDQILQAPYYAIRVAPAVFHTQGGLAIDHKARVLTTEGDIVGNLYAAGGAACGVSGSSVAGYLSGNGLLTAVSLGAIAATDIGSARGVDPIIPACQIVIPDERPAG